MDLTSLLDKAAQYSASDIHLVAGEPPIFRIGGKLERQTDTPALTAATLKDTLMAALPADAGQSLEAGTLSSAETTLSTPNSAPSFFLTAFRTADGLAANIRVLLPDIPALELIGGDALDVLERVSDLKRGLVLITGPTGSGKQTTASSLVDRINRTRAERIFVLEDIPSYPWRNQQSIVTTLPIGRAYDGYESAAQTLMRGADPDVILFNDLPTADAVRQAMILADTGHLVVAVMAAESAPEALSRLAYSFPEPRDSGYEVLARTLVVVFNQRLAPHASRPGRIPIYEFLFNSPTVQQAIRAGAAIADLDAALQSESETSSRSRNVAIERLVEQGLVDAETAAKHRH